MLVINKAAKRYENGRGITDISYKLERGTIYSLIGPNGSGKTTLVKCIAGMQNLSSGTIELNGCSTLRRDIKADIGYALEEHDIYPDMTIYELLDLVNEVKYQGAFGEQVDSLLKAFELWEHRHMLYEKGSYGMKKKTGICISLLGNPELILLDEPTNGIDTKGIITLKKEILRAKENASIVLITSHVLDFVGQVADWNLFLKEGKIVSCLGKNVNLETEYERLYF